jgi:hypothetical protein
MMQLWNGLLCLFDSSRKHEGATPDLMPKAVLTLIPLLVSLQRLGDGVYEMNLHSMERES